MRKNLFYILIGSLFVILACIASFFLMSHPSETQFFTLKVFLGLGASAFMVALPGTISVEMPKGVHATGVFAVFCIIVFLAPEWKEQPVRVSNGPKLYSAIGYLKLVDSNNQPLSDSYEGITFSISPPKSGIAQNGRFLVENIPWDTCTAEQIVLTINKEGYQSLTVALEVDLPEDINPFTIKKDSTIFTINPRGVVCLKKKPKQVLPLDYNPDNSNVPIQQ